MDDLCPSFIAEAFFEFFELFSDDVVLEAVACEDLFIFADLFKDLREFVGDLLHFKTGETLQAHIEDGFRLCFVETVPFHEGRAGCLGIRCFFDEFDDVVDVVDGDLETFEDMFPLFGDAQIIRRPTADDLETVFEIDLQDLAQRQDLRRAFDDRKIGNAVACLQLRVAVQLIEDDFGIRAF